MGVKDLAQAMTKPPKAFWVSYDLGLKGDYTGFYTWLDSVGAKECGDSIAFFAKYYEGDLVQAVKEDIQKYAELKKTDRVYLIHLDDDTKKMKGNFLFGGRKRAPWEGYAKQNERVEEDSV